MVQRRNGRDKTLLHRMRMRISNAHAAPNAVSILQVLVSS